ncbi:MAG TPA: hypothetical protein VE549_00565, partial [Myxococcaceae bacterium]|nr:hypothetical protein [Myxococcaceae bacterium]
MGGAPTRETEAKTFRISESADVSEVASLAGPALAGAFGLGWFIRWAGWKPLDPTHLSWLLNGEDWGTHLLGWLFFRNEPWALPLGRLTSYVYPVGTT